MTTKIDNLSKPMDKKKLESFKKRLEERQQSLRKTVSRTEEDGRIADQDTAQDIADRAASSYTKEFLFSQSNNDRQLLQMVETALARIREGAFGECVSCGNEINAKRLEAVPWTRARRSWKKASWKRPTSKVPQSKNKRRCEKHLLFHRVNNFTQYRLKATSIFISTATGRPSFLDGSNFQVFTPSRAFSSRPMPSDRTTRWLCTRPSTPTMMFSTTTP